MQSKPSRSRWLLVLLGVIFSTSSVPAQPNMHLPWMTDTVNSKVLGKRTIYIVTPDDYYNGQSQYPVLIVLDAEDLMAFRLWVSQADYLADNCPGLPKMIVVGIVNGDDRIHDMTPPATGSSVKQFPNAGGADAFAELITEEVLARVRSEFRTVPTAILAGHSAGGLFALTVAAKRPDAFQGIIAMSPALWYNDSTLVEIYSNMIGSAKKPPRLFVSSGGLEPDIDITSNRFAQRLDVMDSMKGLFQYRSYPDLTHSLTPASLGDGLRFIFDPVLSAHLATSALDPTTADSVAVNTAIQSAQESFARSARSLGLPEGLPENVINQLGYRLLGRKKVSLAISLFERNLHSYPESVNVYDSLADGLLAAGDTTAALGQLRSAVQVARRTKVPVPSETQRKLNALESR